MIFLLLYALVLVVLVISPHYQEIKMWIAYMRGQTMEDMFPNFIDWKEGDEIYFSVNSNNDIGCYLVAMCNKYIIVEYNGRTQKVYPYQIKLNESHQIRKTKEDVKAFHEDILPILSNGQSQFPKIESTIKQLQS